MNETKEELKKEVCKIIDSMDNNEVNNLMNKIFNNNNNQNDGIEEKLLIIEGEFKKLTKLLYSTEENIKKSYEVKNKKTLKLEAETLINFHKFLNNSVDNLDNISEIKLLNIFKLKEEFGSFKNGFYSFISKILWKN